MFPALVFSEASSTPIEVNFRYYYSAHSQPISILRGFNFSDPQNFSTPSQMSWENNSEPLKDLGGESSEYLTSKSVGLFSYTQALLDKFFIEKLLYQFSGVDWIFFFFLPKSCQFFIYKYSLFIQWALLNTNNIGGEDLSRQINKLSSLNQLGEISVSRAFKKI
jgi:hypothetical protein